MNPNIKHYFNSHYQTSDDEFRTLMGRVWDYLVNAGGLEHRSFSPFSENEASFEQIERLTENKWKQSVSLKVEKHKVFTPNVVDGTVFHDLIEAALNTNNTYQDLVFKNIEPVQYNDLPEANVAYFSYFDVRSAYNYYSKSYEETIIGVSELSLPNIYAIEAMETGQNIPKLEVDGIPVIGGALGPTGYFEKYGKTLETVSIDLIETMNSFYNTFSPKINQQLQDDLYSRRFSYPMFVDLEFNTGLNLANFLELFTEGIFSTKLIQELIENVNNSSTNNIVFQEFIDGDLENIPLNSLDLTNWIKTTITGILSGEENIESSSPEDKLKKILQSLDIDKKVSEVVVENMRSYEQIWNGSLSKTESMFFKIEKLDASSNELIQTIFLPNVPNIDILNYVDTQVKFDKGYKYRVFAWQAVFGTKYNYKNYKFTDLTPQPVPKTKNKEPNIDDGNNLPIILKNEIKNKYNIPKGIEESEYVLYTFDVEFQPVAKLVEVPFFETGEIRVVDNPPVYPDVEFVQFKNVLNKIMINLQPLLDTIYEYPIPFNSIEALKLTPMYKQQGRKIGDKLQFRGEGQTKTIQVFRLENKPSEYKDFNKALLREIEYDIQSSIMETIEPNKQYFYCFRTIDIHGHLSNPSYVYKIEMIYNGGANYLLVEIVNLEKEKIKKTHKSFKRTMQVTPALIHTVVKDNKLGVDGTNPFNKQYKFRITSKHTGRKIDLNVNFSLETKES